MSANNQTQYSRRKQLNVRINEDLITYMKMLALRHRVSLERYVATVFSKHIAEIQKYD